MFGERLNIRKLVCFFQLYQCVCYLTILQSLELLPANSLISLDHQEHNAATNTVCCSKGTLPYRQDPQFPPALHFKYRSKLPHIERSRLSCHRAVRCKNRAKNSVPDLLSRVEYFCLKIWDKNCFIIPVKFDYLMISKHYLKTSRLPFHFYFNIVRSSGSAGLSNSASYWPKI